jgi:hypothetical protein
MVHGFDGHYTGQCRTVNAQPGGPIRTISVSLLAVAALIAGIFLTRARQQPAPDAVSDEGIQRTTVSLEELRQAGF